MRIDRKARLALAEVWRLEAPGVWRVVFDRGEPVCAPCEKP